MKIAYIYVIKQLLVFWFCHDGTIHKDYVDVIKDLYGRI